MGIRIELLELKFYFLRMLTTYYFYYKLYFW